MAITAYVDSEKNCVVLSWLNNEQTVEAETCVYADRKDRLLSLLRQENVSLTGEPLTLKPELQDYVTECMAEIYQSIGIRKPGSRIGGGVGR